MKLVGINGSTAEVSYNRKLLQFIQAEYSHVFDLEILELTDVPKFEQFVDQTDNVAIQTIYRKVNNADGVIFSTSEHSHTVPSTLKNIIEHLSVDLHPFSKKPVLVIGASYYDQGSSRAQLHLKQILEAPGVNAYAMPGNEFLLANARQAFDENGRIADKSTANFLSEVLSEFIAYVDMITEIQGRAKPIYPPEDLTASNKIETTIDVDQDDDDWVEKAADLTEAAKGNDYVKLNHGILTVNQLNYLLESLPMELNFVDENNQFLYYNYTKEESEMFAGRKPEQVGQSLDSVHPLSEEAMKNVENVVQQLRAGRVDSLDFPIPTQDSNAHLVHFYKAMKDHEGYYRGVNEFIFDTQRVVDLYLSQTGQKLVKDDTTDAVSSATTTEKATEETDANSSASSAWEDDNDEATDATSAASE